MNCTKALPIPGYQQICSLMEPFKQSLQGPVRASEANGSDFASTSQIQKSQFPNKF